MYHRWAANFKESRETCSLLLSMTTLSVDRDKEEKMLQINKKSSNRGGLFLLKLSALKHWNHLVFFLFNNHASCPRLITSTELGFSFHLQKQSRPTLEKLGGVCTPLIWCQRSPTHCSSSTKKQILALFIIHWGQKQWETQHLWQINHLANKHIVALQAEFSIVAQHAGG